MKGRNHAGQATLRVRAAGVSFMEMILVILLLGILAAVAVPRLDIRSMEVMPIAEQVAGEIRYAQSLAMARGRPHVFSIGGGGYAITSDGSPVPLSNGQMSGTYGDLQLASPVDIEFLPRFGQPDGAASITLSANATSVTISVAGETGYVQIDN